MPDSTPRSIRLNKAHREDMLNAVMKQWTHANPAPEGSRFEDFIEAVLTRLMKPKRNDPEEMRALTHIANRTRALQEIKRQIPDTCTDLVNLRGTENFQLVIRLDSGENGAVYGFELPKALADKLEIPYLFSRHKNRVYFDDDEWPSYRTDSEQSGNHDSVEIVTVAGQGRIALTIPRSFPAYKTFNESKRALRAWEEDRKKTASEIKDYLDQFNTTGQIREQWPEMEQYLPAHIADPARVIALPALTRSRLNERLGLA